MKQTSYVCNQTRVVVLLIHSAVMVSLQKPY